ncbi:site-specific DNA-methyltransferase [Morganella morganii]|uniref:site-specific DNA-methyltransferase n=1 Tax=Morganellaceae TaxID=1903414 RepID=UPI0016513EB4|nr:MULTISPECIES: site-specific DNA-methyltransferase [Morganellaceae]EKX6519818.1 site-specific DNA-methyltransferase [Proteus mirabilis]MBT0330460.1 site-specific DNA-methyltransferase [Morganella morganii subsp. morganii]MBV7313904.1 site-specific DNA-methyltransferase [Morganella morganii]
MDKLKMHSPDMTQQNIEKIQALFPNCVTEAKGADGELKLTIDFDQLKQELSNSIVEGSQERFQMSWPGKKEALMVANAPTSDTLRPLYDESVDFESTKNLFIEGDNLNVLKVIQESYLNKIKFIYIDPPYNTGKDFIYKDRFSESGEAYLHRSGQVSDGEERLVSNPESSGRYHSNWLNMIYPRLKLARNLLSDDGIIFISIDEKEFHNLKKVCDEIFGQANYAGEIIWKNSSKNDQAYISIQHEYILAYVKNKEYSRGDWEEKKEGLDEIYKAFDSFRKKHGDDWDAIHRDALDWYKQFSESNPISNNKHYNWMDERGVYFADNISKPANGYYYDILHPVTGKPCKKPAGGWRFIEETMNQKIADNRIHFGKDHTTVPNNKTYLSNTEFQSLTSIKYKDGRVASNFIKELMGNKVFTNPKDHGLLVQLMKAIKLEQDDVILDFFAGSGTTAHAVMQLNAEDGGNRKFIMVQLPEECDKKSEAYKAGYKTIAEISKDRIRRAGAKIVEGECHKDWNKDVGFRVLKVDTSNMADVYYSPDQVTQGSLDLLVDNIKADRTDEDLLFQVLLDWGVDLTLPIKKETIQGKTVFFVDDDALVACFDLRINEALIKELATKEPLRVVFRDDGFESDAVKINAEQIFKQVSPHTEVKAI